MAASSEEVSFSMILSRLERIEDQVNKVIRRQDSLENSVNLIYHDRTILEDIQLEIRSLKEGVKLSRESQSHMNREIQTDISEVKEVIDHTPASVKEVVMEHIDTLTHQIQQGKEILIKPSLFGKLKLLVKRRGKLEKGGD